MTNDHARHLKLLAVLHFVIAGLLAVCGCIPLIHLTIGLSLLNMPDAVLHGPAPPLTLRTWVGLMFTVLPTIAILTTWGGSVMICCAGRYLMQRRHHTFCLATAGLLCGFMPLGTILGALTIIVLANPEVKAAFESQPLLAKDLSAAIK